MCQYLGAIAHRTFQGIRKLEGEMKAWPIGLLAVIGLERFQGIQGTWEPPRKEGSLGRQLRWKQWLGWAWVGSPSLREEDPAWETAVRSEGPSSGMGQNSGSSFCRVWGLAALGWCCLVVLYIGRAGTWRIIVAGGGEKQDREGSCLEGIPGPPPAAGGLWKVLEGLV